MKLVLAILLAANALAPSALLAPAAIRGSPAQSERKTGTVLGIVQGIAMRAIPGGVITQFALCDSRCINVVEFSKPNFYVGQSLTIAGIFHQIFSNGVIQARNTVVVTAPLP
jgi:hypothetical protein